ncbi:dTDP-4-dehydrorhamnose 3,5-epimerase family protein [Kineococcus sp. NPDC059986]|uniref:dTDP-4-dehydrorhamnose 3,5-epimerase family protein n=1 Tax=Kineococcus sp. NPDC059986 TaxID=3155538 RepID=UPI00344BE66A
MEIEETAVRDAYRLRPHRLDDGRGWFGEVLRTDVLARGTGHAFRAEQVNCSVSRRGTLRGLHGVTSPPGQAKVVRCNRGRLFDVVVDVRPGSPTWGRVAGTVLEAGGDAVFVAEGLAHGFLALDDDTEVMYLCSTTYVPGSQVDIDPFDETLAVPWPVLPDGPPVLSAKDAAAPSLAAVHAAGRLVEYAHCRRLYAARAGLDVTSSRADDGGRDRCGPGTATERRRP